MRCITSYAHGRMVGPCASSIARGPDNARPRPLILDERLEALRARRVPQLTQRLGFDLPDPLARDLEVLADFLERVVRLLADPEPHAQHLLFTRGERGEHLAGLVCEV